MATSGVPARARKLGERGDAGVIVAAIAMPRGEIEGCGERLLEALKLCLETSLVMPAQADIQ